MSLFFDEHFQRPALCQLVAELRAIVDNGSLDLEAVTLASARTDIAHLETELASVAPNPMLLMVLVRAVEPTLNRFAERAIGGLSERLEIGTSTLAATHGL